MFPFEVHRVLKLTDASLGDDGAEKVRQALAETFQSTVDSTTGEIHFNKVPRFSFWLRSRLLGGGRIRVTPTGQHLEIDYTVSFLRFVVPYVILAIIAALAFGPAWLSEGDLLRGCFPATLLGFVFVVNYLVYVIDFHSFVKRTVQRALGGQVQGKSTAI
jgi:hypothetical protein